MPAATDDHGHHSDHDEPIDKRAHKRLLDGVQRLNKTQFIKKPTRNEPTIRRTEFSLVKPDTIGRADADPAAAGIAPSVRKAAKAAVVSVPDMVRVLNRTSKLVSIGRELRNNHTNRTVLEKPLERPVVERIARTIGYERTKKKLNRWNAVVTRNRAEDHMEFPLQQDNGAVTIADPSAPKYTHFKIQSELEVALQALDPPSQRAATEVYRQGGAATADETAAEQQKLSRAEMIERSKEMRLLRIRESQRSAKARMQNKIKSKKFHKILKKEKLKDQLKEFEVLQKQDPEAAMRKLDQLEKQRAEERALLRHKNTGTWAKNLQVRAKYDKDVRKELSEQLAISRELTAKHTAADDEEEDDDNDEAADAATANGDPTDDPFNPWLKRGGAQTERTEAEEAAADAVGGYRKYWNERNANEEALRRWREDVGKPTPIKLRPKVIKSRSGSGWLVEECSAIEPVEERRPAVAVGPKRAAADALDDLFDEAEDTIRDKVATKLQHLSRTIAGEGASADDDHAKAGRPKKRGAKNDLADLSFKQKAKRPQIDAALEHDDAEADGAEVDADEAARKQLDELRRLSNLKSTPAGAASTVGGVANINPNTFMRVQPKHLQTAVPDLEGEHDQSDDEADRHLDAKRLTIAEAFEDDDIVANFEQERADEKRKNEPEDVVLTLPGWGSWGGNGIQPRKQRTKKLILKFPVVEPRKEENKGNVIIVDNDNRKLRDHQVSQLPFPFTSVADYEASIRAPIGRDFVPAVAHQLLTRPAVQTQLGAIIQPMSEDVLLKRPAVGRTKTAKRIAALGKAKAAKV